MDLKNFEATSTYAIEAVYRDYWFQIPEKYRLREKAQVQPEQPQQKIKPLTYKDVEKKEEPKQENDYDLYCNILNDRTKYFDLQPFFDPQLDFENRLHYKLTNVPYPERKGPWFIITWNCGNGVLKSNLTNRRFDTQVIELEDQKVKVDFINSKMDLTLCFTSNTLQGLFELQEHIRISRREKACVDTRKHSIIGSFPVTLNLIDAALSKMTRDKGTLCTLTMNLEIAYPVIGNIQSAEYGIIKEIHSEIDKDTEFGPKMLARDIITEEI